MHDNFYLTSLFIKKKKKCMWERRPFLCLSIFSGVCVGGGAGKLNWKVMMHGSAGQKSSACAGTC